MAKQDRNYLVKAGIEGKNQLSKSHVIISDRERSKHDRKYQKRQFKKHLEEML